MGPGDVESEWDLRVGVVAAYHQDHAVYQDQGVNQIGERKASIGRREDDNRNHRRRRFQQPGEIIIDTDRRYDQGANAGTQQDGRKNSRMSSLQ